ncbi:AAA family ATPase [Aeromicrobium sp. HA]|uniref:AAA family ATPase n=1 Tax=Aeromicrobium sp. HA TaxID=3009077 RepID=UPI0022AF46F4|nr:AAA family ATPase [Aeromicrobium sp. HA]
MRVSRIEFAGFRRLADTATSIDGSLTAFVGFNEAGKTTVLNALTWFTQGGIVSPVDFNRSRPPASDSTPVVKVFYELDDDDQKLFADIAMEKPPTTLVMNRNRDGGLFRSFIPRPSRPTAAFTAAAERLAIAKVRLASQLEGAADEDAEDPNDWIDMVESVLGDFSGEWPEQSLRATENLSSWLREVPPGRKQSRDAKLADLLDVVVDLMGEDHPSEAVWQAISGRRPEFVLFQEQDRLLETSYEINPDQRSLVHPAVVRLLSLAEIDLDMMWTHIQGGDSTKRETLLERGNDRLREVFDQAWNQSKVTVRFNVNGHRLEVLIKELHSAGDVTTISERSDGMRTFVALVAFLETGDHDVPPVLLIDEAETHLHYDAQADLVSVLLKSVDTTQVFYTTHSPGCLPSDLGTGIRVVVRDPDYADASVIKNNFWNGEGPGFSPLLFAMGAGAAAFSMCRNAVLAEGASDMVLLPSLIRAATGIDDLDFQVAPGLANAHGSGIRVEEVAARVVYLTDGDQGGKDHEKLLTAVGVDASRIFRLPENHAVEDLLRPEFYLATVNEFLARMGQGKRFEATDVPPGIPIAKAFADWAKTNRVQAPSKVEIAYALLRREDRQLTSRGKKALARLHEKFGTAFAVRSAPK